MSRMWFLTGCLACVLVFGPALADAQAAQGEKKDDAAKKEDKDEKKDEKKGERYITLGSLSGQIVRVGDGGSTFTIRLRGAIPTWVPTRIWYGRVQGRTQFTPTSEDLDIVLADEAKIRIPMRPELDEKGRPKPGTPKRDPKDRDSNLGGMKGEPGDLAKDQWVTVTLGRSTNPKNPQVVAIVVLVQRDTANYNKRDKDN